MSETMTVRLNESMAGPNDLLLLAGAEITGPPVAMARLCKLGIATPIKTTAPGTPKPAVKKREKRAKP